MNKVTRTMFILYILIKTTSRQCLSIFMFLFFNFKCSITKRKYIELMTLQLMWCLSIYYHVSSFLLYICVWLNFHYSNLKLDKNEGRERKEGKREKKGANSRIRVWITRSRGFRRFLVEGDSNLVIGTIRELCHVPRRLKTVIDNIKRLAGFWATRMPSFLPNFSKLSLPLKAPNT